MQSQRLLALPDSYLKVGENETRRRIIAAGLRLTALLGDVPAR
jgi:hypothetical protein